MCEPRNRDNGANDLWTLTAYYGFRSFIQLFVLLHSIIVTTIVETLCQPRSQGPVITFGATLLKNVNKVKNELRNKWINQWRRYGGGGALGAYAPQIPGAPRCPSTKVHA